jgi:hypothetical protein
MQTGVSQLKINVLCNRFGAGNQLLTKFQDNLPWVGVNMLTGAIQRDAKGSYGPLTVSDLPTAGTKRWVIRRKAQVVAAVRGGLISLEAVCDRYMLSPEEFLIWQETIDRYGIKALRVTRLYDRSMRIPFDWVA